MPRSSYYYKSRGNSAYNVMLMNIIDKQYTERPFYGVRRMTVFLKRCGHSINHKRVARLICLMGLEAIYPKRKLSRKDKEHIIYPYLLKELEITRSNQTTK
ncbi:MAG: transposase [Nitrospirae bacterium]|nr:transposase [Nitrospirota bacterium]MBF0534310.1 transposase [Nitrospirota bacterium]MBF0615709.1 transposase [Nitrospirota bacterium]